MRRSITVAIPTYGRNGVLIDTLHALLALEVRPSEILVLDQSERHDQPTTAELTRLTQVGAIRWIRLPTPSIPRAMNRGLREAACDVVLFVDDDVLPHDGLIAAHRAWHERADGVLVAGRVIQPWHTAAGDDQPAHAADAFIGANFSVARDRAVEIGGFDENFVRVAYNFEREFAYRWRASGGRVVYEPAACLNHLKVRAGGTRSFGEHLTTIRPSHAVGAYYHLLRTWAGWPSFVEFVKRPVRAVSTRHHLRRPWWIPVTFCAELAGMAWAARLAARGPALLQLPHTS